MKPTHKGYSFLLRKITKYLQGLIEAFTFAKIKNDAFKLSESDFIALTNPFIKLIGYATARVSQWTNF